jgi:glycosyltransferase involved in cell wall biosynthesis
MDTQETIPERKYRRALFAIAELIKAIVEEEMSEEKLQLAFLGRISPEKRPDRAIKIARAAGIPLKIAAKVDKVDEHYFRNKILPLIDGRGVEFIGEINEREKTKFLGEAGALLFPVDWPEPFGLVMIEAMACGTPLLAFRCGSIPEVIEDGVTGKVVDSEQEAVAALPGLLSYDRRAVRHRLKKDLQPREWPKIMSVLIVSYCEWARPTAKCGAPGSVDSLSTAAMD